MKFNTLYARTNTGAIQEWTIIVDNNTYRTIYGQKDGQLVATAPTVCSGKNIGKTNETTANQQALKEAKSIFKKKLKEGYKEDIDKIDEQDFFQPMLAKKFIDYQDKVVYPMIVEDKLNGIRCVISAKGAFSRTGEQFHCLDHILEELSPLFIEQPTLILDGELFNYTLKNKLNAIASLVSVNRKISDVTDEDRERAKEIVQFHVYDGFNIIDQEYDLFVSQSSALVNRKTGLKHIICKHNLVYTIFHPFDYVYSYEPIVELMRKVREENREGLVLKNPDAPYECKRSKHMLKLKVFESEEFEAIEFLEGTGNWAGKVKKVVCRLNVPSTNGKTTFESNIRGSMPELTDLWVNKDQHENKGKRVSVDFQEYSEYGIPLIPYCDAMFRDYE
jgi:ATP-dependent DNA ligase